MAFIRIQRFIRNPQYRHVWEQANGEVPEGYVVAFRDGNRQNCDLSNLRAFCQRCHNKYDAKHRAATRSHTKAMKEKTLSINFEEYDISQNN